MQNLPNLHNKRSISPGFTRATTFLLLMVLLICSNNNLYASTNDPAFIYVNISSRTLSVIKNGKPEAIFENISIGKGGAAKLRQRGDDKTPLGEFKIIWVNKFSRYHLFFGLDFPNLDYAVRAYKANIINDREFVEIQKAYALKQHPPQETNLGGYIGIHGIGKGDLETHLTYNWTDGCIALTNEQIVQLAKWVTIGTKVIIST